MPARACAVGLLLLLSSVPSCTRQDSSATAVWLDPEPAPEIRGLEVTKNAPFRLSAQKGRVVLVSFGYTSCLELCPDTFATAHRVLNSLGDSARGVVFAYITVDPERDKPASFAAFMASVDPRFDGVYLEGPALSDVLAAYHVTVRKRIPDPARYAHRDVDPAGLYTLDHSSGFWLVDSAGRLRARYLHEASDQEILLGARTLLQEKS